MKVLDFVQLGEQSSSRTQDTRIKSGALAKLSYRLMTRDDDWRRRSERCLSEEVESDDG